MDCALEGSAEKNITFAMRRHFTKKVRLVTALVITGRRPWPGIAKKSLIWPQSGATFYLVSEMNLARGGS